VFAPAARPCRPCAGWPAAAPGCAGAPVCPAPPLRMSGWRCWRDGGQQGERAPAPYAARVKSAHSLTPLGACPSNRNTLLVGRLRRRKRSTSQILRAERAY
jgi:hypothetical protein